MSAVPSFRALSGAGLFALVTLTACSSTSSPSSPTLADPGPAGDDSTPPPEGTSTAKAPTTPPAQPADACGSVAKSKCTPANPGSVVRGVVKFDPAHFQGKAKPTLRVFMFHQWTLTAGEEKTGGHLHAYTSSSDLDLVKGEARFTLDLCELGTAMYSEENCGFNIVTLLDEDGNNDPDTQGMTAFVPGKGELTKLTPVSVSCKGLSQCLSITADCTDGDACTTYQPITSCACATTTCPSDDKYCK